MVTLGGGPPLTGVEAGAASTASPFTPASRPAHGLVLAWLSPCGTPSSRASGSCLDLIMPGRPFTRSARRLGTESRRRHRPRPGMEPQEGRSQAPPAPRPRGSGRTNAGTGAAPSREPGGTARRPTRRHAQRVVTTARWTRPGRSPTARRSRTRRKSSTVSPTRRARIGDRIDLGGDAGFRPGTNTGPGPGSQRVRP